MVPCFASSISGRSYWWLSWLRNLRYGNEKSLKPPTKRSLYLKVIWFFCLRASPSSAEVPTFSVFIWPFLSSLSLSLSQVYIFFFYPLENGLITTCLLLLWHTISFLLSKVLLSFSLGKLLFSYLFVITQQIFVEYSQAASILASICLIRVVFLCH